jgi:DNA-directed RNA polymerase specialized sigma24 family protein
MPMHTPDDFYGRFIEPIEDRMIRSVWRITRNAQDAEDAMQAALMAGGSTGIESSGTPSPRP